MKFAGLPHFEGVNSPGVFKFDGLRAAFLTVHAGIILYVSLGWLMPTRGALLVYTLVLPLMVLQWVLNGGASIVNNFENLARVGQWSDPRNSFEGTFFQSLLVKARIPASQAQITTALLLADADLLACRPLPHDSDRAPACIKAPGIKTAFRVLNGKNPLPTSVVGRRLESEFIRINPASWVVAAHRLW